MAARLSGAVAVGVFDGMHLGRQALLQRERAAGGLPAHGIYAVWVRRALEDGWRMGAMSVGIRPTFGGGLRTLEVHVLDWEGDLYGEDLRVAFADWIRPEKAFPDAAALVAAMTDDVSEVRRRLPLLGPPGE